jgi:hypothetical protein
VHRHDARGLISQFTWQRTHFSTNKGLRMPKPLIYVALSRGVLHELEFASYLPHLQAIADVQIWDGAGNPSPQALDDACANAQILITGWGVPFLSQLDHWTPDDSPLRMVMHSAGTVKQLVPVDSITRGLVVSRANDSSAESVAKFTVGHHHGTAQCLCRCQSLPPRLTPCYQLSANVNSKEVLWASSAPVPSAGT